MHQVRMEEWTSLERETFNKFRINLPSGGWFPALRDLSWCLTETNLPYIDLFLSPCLKSFSFHQELSWSNTSPPNVRPILASALLALPTSSLERISGQIGHPRGYFKDSFSSAVLGCGPSFTEYDSPIPLSDAAINHLIQLPHLHTLSIYDPPPDYSTTSLPLVFPPLKKLTLGDTAARGWLSLLRRLEDGTSSVQGRTRLFKAKESLKVLNVRYDPDITIDSSFVSPIQSFRNLVHLNVDTYCHGGVEGRCIFKLNDDNVAELAMALTQIELLLLGHACFEDACSTTVACLLQISVHCTKLKNLEIHFNTTNIVDDFENILEDPLLQQLRSLPRCSLTRLDVYQIPLSLDEHGFEIVLNGMMDIFPSLERCNGFETDWDELSRRLVSCQEE